MLDLFMIGCAAGAGSGAGKAVGQALFPSGPTEETKELRTLRAELAGLKAEIQKLQGPETLAARLKLHVSRLPAAKRAARALGIHVTELPTVAVDLDCSVARVVAVWSKKTRAEVLAEEAATATDPANRALLDQFR